jgi:hypothetical protein
MNKIKYMVVVLIMSLFVSLPALAQKRLIFMDGYLGWYYSLPSYLIEHVEELEQRPFSGVAVVGNIFTSYVMSADPNSNNVTYERVWNEVGGLKDLFKTKTDNFLRINLDFPGDFWDDAAWQKTTSNFAVVAKAAKNLGFKGIVFDDEVYAGGQHVQANFMSNFKFPKRAEVFANPENYEDWEVSESVTNRGNWIDYNCTVDGIRLEDSNECSYRNEAYSFKQHMDKVAARFKTIMQAMQDEFPDLDVLVLHGPATAHHNTNISNHFIKPNSLFRTNEYKGAMFLGFKQGLNDTASLHDLGEFYRYQTTEHFENAYQWRKFDIVSDQYNQDLDDSYHWVVPVTDRASWSEDVDIGFMVSDVGLKDNNHAEYDLTGACNPVDFESRLSKALKHSDEYVMFYSNTSHASCEDDVRWADTQSTIPSAWLNMMNDVFKSIQATGAEIIPIILPLLLDANVAQKAEKSRRSKNQ